MSAVYLYLTGAWKRLNRPDITPTGSTVFGGNFGGNF